MNNKSRHGIFGNFISKGFCQSQPGKRFHGIQFENNPLSIKGYFDKKTKAYKYEAYSERECKGDKVAEHKFPIDKCLRMPTGPFFLKQQPPQFALFTRK